MEIILLSKVNKLGNIGNLVHVKSGYARNYLIPTGKAMVANKENLNSFEAQKIALEKENIHKLTIAQSRAEKIKNIRSITITSKSGKEGKIFGSIRSRNIVKELLLLGIKVHEKEIKFPNGVLRNIGDHEVLFQTHNNISEKLIVRIIAKI